MAAFAIKFAIQVGKHCGNPSGAETQLELALHFVKNAENIARSFARDGCDQAAVKQATGRNAGFFQKTLVWDLPSGQSLLY